MAPSLVAETASSNKTFSMRPLNYRLSQARVLIVDDIAFNLQLINAALAKAGFQKMDTARDGVEALEKTLSLKPDIVLLDLNMPNLDGFGYCERVRNHPEAPRMPIIVQTIIEEREAKLRALSSGADDFLNKPLDQEELVLRVCMHLERYFMLQDTSDMCRYLKMEVEQAQIILQRLEKSGVLPSMLHAMDKHYEALKEMAVLPSFVENNS